MFRLIIEKKLKTSLQETFCALNRKEMQTKQKMRRNLRELPEANLRMKFFMSFFHAFSLNLQKKENFTSNVILEIKNL